MDIDKAFKEFMEFPEGSDQKTVTTVSCKLFAKWYSEQLQKHIDEQVEKIVKKTLDEDALTAAYLYGFSDARKRIKELEERLIEAQTRTDDLERWIAAIADDKQIPAWIQQSARSLLALEG